MKTDVIYALEYTSCIHESAFATVELHTTKLGAMKAMLKSKRTEAEAFRTQRLKSRSEYQMTKLPSYQQWRVTQKDLIVDESAGPVPSVPPSQRPMGDLIEEWRMQAVMQHKKGDGLNGFYLRLCEIAVAWAKASSPEVVKPWNGVIDPADFKVDTYRDPDTPGWFRSSDSGVRVTHTPTGIFVDCHTERSQHANKALAWEAVLDQLKQSQLGG